MYRDCNSIFPFPASLADGVYLCLRSGKWDKGMRLLARSGGHEHDDQSHSSWPRPWRKNRGCDRNEMGTLGTMARMASWAYLQASHWVRRLSLFSKLILVRHLTDSQIYSFLRMFKGVIYILYLSGRTIWKTHKDKAGKSKMCSQNNVKCQRKAIIARG